MIPTLLGIFLFAIAISLVVYIARNIFRDRKLSSADAIALLGTIIAVILGMNLFPSSLSTNTPTITPTLTDMPTTDPMQASIATATAFAQVSNLEFGPTDGELIKTDSNAVRQNAQVNLENFITSARFYNPENNIDGSWSYGFFFRDFGQGQYALGFSSSKDWTITYYLFSQADTTFEVLSNKRYQDLNMLPGGYNDITLIVNGKIAIVFVNNTYLGTVELPQDVIGGMISTGAGFYINDAIGVPIHFDDFVIHSVE